MTLISWGLCLFSAIVFAHGHARDCQTECATDPNGQVCCWGRATYKSLCEALCYSSNAAENFCVSGSCDFSAHANNMNAEQDEDEDEDEDEYEGKDKGGDTVDSFKEFESPEEDDVGDGLNEDIDNDNNIDNDIGKDNDDKNVDKFDNYVHNDEKPHMYELLNNQRVSHDSDPGAYANPDRIPANNPTFSPVIYIVMALVYPIFLAVLVVLTYHCIKESQPSKKKKSKKDDYSPIHGRGTDSSQFTDTNTDVITDIATDVPEVDLPNV